MGMESKKQTAVEWLVETIKQNVHNSFEEFELLVNQAKEMEKEQIMDAWNDGWTESSDNSRQYYNETFKQ
jgi:hypothetical protein